MAGTSSSGVGRVIRSAANALSPPNKNEDRNGRARRNKGVSSRSNNAPNPNRAIIGYSDCTYVQVDKMVRIMPQLCQVFTE